MALETKHSRLIAYFRKSGNMPRGTLSTDPHNRTVGNVYVDGQYYGAFDFLRREFIDKA